MSNVRYARDADAGAVTRLLRRAHAALTIPIFASGVLLVLESSGGELGAVVHVELRTDIGHVDALVVDPALRGTGLETRMLGVADALCAAHGCRAVEVAVT